MRHSIRKKLVLILVAMVSGTLMFCILLNSLFLESYYYTQKENVLNQVYDQFASVEDVKSYFDESKNLKSLNKLCENNNITLTIFDYSGTVIYSNGRSLVNLFMNRLLQGQIDLSESRDVKLYNDESTGLGYLEMYGRVCNEAYFIMRVPIESIRQNVMISNRFFIYITSLTLLLSTAIMWIVSKQFTKPIKKLVGISERMCELDFQVKYDGNSDDEIDTLGRSMNKLSETLETTIADLKKANNELQKDIDQKVEVDNMRKDFISNVSHELKTPIALIQGYAEGLKEEINDDPESREFYCDVIIDEANKMNRLVRNLLALNQLEFGNTTVEMTRFNIVSLIDGVLNKSKIVIEQKQAHIFFDNSQEFYVWADEFMIEQVVTNYINNALNHLDGERNIQIDLVKNENNIRVSVFNNGKNIPEEDLDKLWIKFYKVDKARTREYGGNGIGLSIVKAIMDQHHKKYGVSNEKDGVVFWFEVESAQNKREADNEEVPEKEKKKRKGIKKDEHRKGEE